MLEIMKKLDAGTIRGLILATIPLLVLIASMFGLDEAIVGAKLTEWGEKLVAVITLGGIAWAAYARVFKPTPPLTETAAKKTAEMISKQQGGFTKLWFLGILIAICGVVACTGTRLAYKEAGSDVDKQAYVVVEHYSALVKEANELAHKPGTPREVIEAMQAADRAVLPVVRKVRGLRDTYAQFKDSQNQQELQKAVNDAILLIADMVQAVKQARGET